MYKETARMRKAKSPKAMANAIKAMLESRWCNGLIISICKPEDILVCEQTDGQTFWTVSCEYGEDNWANGIETNNTDVSIEVDYSFQISIWDN